MDAKALTRNWNYPTSIRFGVGRIAELPAACRDAGMRRPLLVTDPGLRALPMIAQALAALKAAGLGDAVFSDIRPNPVGRNVDDGVAAFRAGGCDGVIAFGGGSALDVGKTIALMSGQTRPLWDFEDREDWWTRVNAAGVAPTIAVPTTAGTGSETQSFALITDDATGMKMACGDPRAAFRVAILDVALTLTQPSRVTALTGIDALSHAVESHVSRAATPASRVFSRAAFALLARGLPRVFADPTDVAARADVQLGAAWAGLAIENAMLGAAHALANPLTAAHHVVHGQAVGLMLPHVVRFNAAAGAAGYDELVAELPGPATDAPAAVRLAAWLEAIRARSGLAGSLTALGLAGADIPALATAAAGQWTAGFNPRPVATGDLSLLYEAAR